MAYCVDHRLRFTRSTSEQYCTGRPDRMHHRKLRKTKQQLALLGYCLVSLHFLCDILSGRPVQSKAIGEGCVRQYVLPKRSVLLFDFEVCRESLCKFRVALLKVQECRSN